MIRAQRLTTVSAGESWTVIGDALLPIPEAEEFLSYCTTIGRSPRTLETYAYALSQLFRLLESADGGRTWRPVDSPGLVALSWDPEMGLWGVEPDGTVHQREQGGSAWEQRGRLPGQPEAMLARDGVLYAAALEDDITGIYRSDDDGATWRLIYRDEQ